MTDTVIKQIVPEAYDVRVRIRDAARNFIREKNLLPPQTLERLRSFGDQCLAKLGKENSGLENFTMAMLNNALWERYFPSIPKEQRLLLLPHCLRNQEKCQAPRDDLGLICLQCHQCNIPKLSERAEALGMPVLVAESSSRTTEWVEQGEIDAVIGISCLASMEKAFPSMLRYAVPGIAIPLTKDGCANTTYDSSFLEDVLAIEENGCTRPVPYSEIHKRIDILFSAEEVSKYLHRTMFRQEQFPGEVIHVLCANGKHYRPTITLGIYTVLACLTEIPEFINPIALAVECFHKASLIHDDIEDNDETRYDEPTLNRRIGLAPALNIGDFLIGEGYRLLGNSLIPMEIRAHLYAEAAQAHCELSLGQAQEFETCHKIITLDQCLETHRLKTAPAFRVSLNLGAIAAGVFENYRVLFHKIADQLGISYQLLDDLADTGDNPASAVDCVMRKNNISRPEARQIITELYEEHRRNTYILLEEITNPQLKIFFYRLTGKVLKEV